MYLPLNCIALRTIRHTDKKSILSVYSRQRGRIAIGIPAGNSREAARLRALLMPLSRFDCIADIRPGRDIHTMRDVRPTGKPTSSDPIRNTICLFIADILSTILREPQQDDTLFLFIADAADRLAMTPHDRLANFHICFLIRLQRMLGIEPDWSTYTTGAVFDMADGIFRQFPPAHARFIPSSEAAAAYSLRRMTFKNSHLFKMTRHDRSTILDRILAYYQLHFASLGSASSLTVLRKTFDF